MAAVAMPTFVFVHGASSTSFSTGAVRMNLRSADPEYLQAAKAALMAEVTDEQFRTTVNYGLQPDESSQVVSADAQVDARTWGTIPRTYIRATLDRVIPLPLQDRMIREADALTPDNKFDVYSVDASHVGMLLRAAEIADILIGLH